LNGVAKSSQQECCWRFAHWTEGLKILISKKISTHRLGR
jgi:hypothetical protein